jgi:cytoskeletal protein RodZ
MFSVGETLRRARLEQNLDLGTLAARTKINVRYLEAIEVDDRQSLPSSFFYKSFVDQYAKSLSLDTQEIDTEVDRVLSADAPLPLPGYESVVSRNVSPLASSPRFNSWRTYATAAAFVLVVVGCSGVYTLWRNWRSTFSAQAAIQSVRSHATASIAEASSAAEKHMEHLTAKNKPRKESAQPAAPVTLATVAHAEARGETIAFGPALPGYKVMLDLLAHEATWLSVSSDGKPVFSGILQPNQSKTVGGKQSAKMRVGNAAGIEVRLNGKLLGPLGARGQVLDVLFTPDRFQIVAPPKESD